jgi:hypothetical protein
VQVEEKNPEPQRLPRFVHGHHKADPCQKRRQSSARSLGPEDIATAADNASGVSGELNVILDGVWRPVSSADSGGVSGAQIHPSCCAEVFVDQSAESVASVELGWRVRADGA